MVASTGTTGKAKTTKAAVRRVKGPPLLCAVFSPGPLIETERDSDGILFVRESVSLSALMAIRYRRGTHSLVESGENTRSRLDVFRAIELVNHDYSFTSISLTSTGRMTMHRSASSMRLVFWRVEYRIDGEMKTALLERHRRRPGGQHLANDPWRYRKPKLRLFRRYLECLDRYGRLIHAHNVARALLSVNLYLVYFYPCFRLTIYDYAV